jgi:hypothetical protein
VRVILEGVIEEGVLRGSVMGVFGGIALVGFVEKVHLELGSVCLREYWLGLG